MTIRWDRAAKTAAVEIDGQTIQLKQGEWTKWIDLTFKVNMIVRVHGMVQMLLMNAGSELQLYISPVNFKPDRRRCRSRRPRPSPPIWRSSSATTARSAGPRRRGRSTKGAWTRRRSWTT